MSRSGSWIFKFNKMSNVRKTIVTNCEKSFLIKNLSQDHNRLDGRAFDEFREVQIEFGKDFGCCFVALGKTRVLAQTSCEIQQPKPSRNNEGILNLNIELNQMAAPNFESGRQSDLAVQLNRLLEKCLKDSKAVDLESLCIKMNEKVWAIRVDINVLNNEGNILDCASIAALTALAHFRRPDVSCDGEEFVIHNYKQRDPIPMVIHHYPVCVTYSIFGGGDFILADPTLLEEGVADAFLSVGINSYKELCGLHLGGKADLTPDVILKTSNKAATRAGIVVQQIKEAVEEDNQKRLERQVHGFTKLLDDETLDDVTSSFSVCLDQWSGIRERRKKKKQKQKTVEAIEEDKDNDEGNVEKDKSLSANIESLGAGTAALIPKDKDGQGQTWDVSDSDKEQEEEDCDVMIIEQPRPLIQVYDSDSEEEAVVVLNADKKTNKKKKKKFTQ